MMNDDEARALGGSDNLIASMKSIVEMGIGVLVVKKGEHGSILLKDGELFALPAYPLEVVQDPTGAGDTFASGGPTSLTLAALAAWSRSSRSRMTPWMAC